jgi:hypothetical protein
LQVAGVTMAKMKKTNGHHPWESSECAKFEAFYPLGTRSRLAYALLLQAGQSKCDVVRMGRQRIRNNMMSMRRQKTGVPFNIEIMPMLQEAIDAMPASNHLTFLITAQGNPFTAAGFGNHFRDLCDAAGLPKRCTTHGLVRRPQLIWRKWARPTISSWRGSVGPRSRKRRCTPRPPTERPWRGGRRSSFQEQELAHLLTR